MCQYLLLQAELLLEELRIISCYDLIERFCDCISENLSLMLKKRFSLLLLISRFHSRRCNNLLTFLFLLLLGNVLKNAEKLFPL